MPDLIFMKIAPGFLPADEEGEAVLHRIKNGTLVLVTLRLQQNLAWRRRYFALIRTGWKCGLQDRFPTPDVLRKAILLELGFAEPQIDLNGEVTLVAQSMRFDKMDHATFAELWDRTCDLFVTRLLPGVDRAMFQAEVEMAVRLLGDAADVGAQ